MPGQINHADGPAIVPECRMIHEGDPVALGRETDVADPSTALVEHFADGIFQAAMTVDIIDDC